MIFQKNGQSYVPAENPDVFCVGETKCQDADIPDDATIPGYHKFFSSAEVPGYAGTALYSKTEPISVAYGLGKDQLALILQIC